ncbi:MAG: ABC transporter substrate-binding protein, partial [Epsilonproteobacteria bacterium]|nr:ABC transporter substrate-binding protein [Campylobacterota bacterium]
MLKKTLLIAALSAGLMASVIKMDLNAKYGANNFHTKGAEKFAKL